MNNMEILADAFEFIENNLQNEIRTQDVADACYCSKSVLEKIFRCVSNLGVHEYIVKRRMMLAARHIASDKNMPILDIAIACGYSTNESFSRAFKSVWNINPSESENKARFSELFQRLYPPIGYGGTYMSLRRNVDISEMSYKAGDLAIINTFERMNKEAGDEDIVFRIGGDEFVMLTASEDIAYAEDVAKRIAKYNGEAFIYDGKEYPLRLHIAVVKFEGKNLRYRDLFEKLHIAILENKN